MRHKIRGDLTSWNTSVYEFENLMKNVGENEDITLEVNSYGGDVFIGIDLCNTLRAHKGKVTAIITGIAASAASVLIMGADEVKAYSNSQIMLHNAWTIVAGNAQELRKAADDLDSIGESVLASYTNRLDADQAKKLLDDETFLSARKAQELGLVDEIIDDKSAEEVESELFSDEVKEINNKLKSRQLGGVAASVSPGELENMIKEMIKNMSGEFLNNEEQKSDGEPPGGKEADQGTALSRAFLIL